MGGVGLGPSRKPGSQTGGHLQMTTAFVDRRTVSIVVSVPGSLGRLSLAIRQLARHRRHHGDARGIIGVRGERPSVMARVIAWTSLRLSQTPTAATGAAEQPSPIEESSPRLVVSASFGRAPLHRPPSPCASSPRIHSPRCPMPNGVVPWRTWGRASASAQAEGIESVLVLAGTDPEWLEDRP